MAAERYEQLGFTDDFMFCKILEHNEDICKELVELILDEKIRRIDYLSRQQAIEITSDGKGIRLDVYMEADNTVYDLEMQAVTSRNLPKRSRYYQGMIDLNLIERGADYGKLKKSYVIFICLRNPFDGKRHRYTFENWCRENPELTLGDETTKIFLTPDGTADDVSENMAAFLAYIAGKTCTDEFTAKIENAVNAARRHEEWRLEYMTLQMRDQENFERGMERGMEQGLEQGMEQGVKALITTCRELGCTREETQRKLMTHCEASEEQIADWLEKYWENHVL